jgi:DNA-binding response OmpR family regulator
MRKLLIAHSEEYFTQWLAGLLQEQFEVYICHTGPDALAKLNTVKPNFLIINLSLSIMSGLDIVREAEHKPLTMVAITDILTPDIMQGIIDAGFDAVFHMPCSMKSILSELNAIIENKFPSL